MLKDSYSPQMTRAKLLFPLLVHPGEGRQPGPIAGAVLRRQLGFQGAPTPRTARLVQHDVCCSHRDLGELDHLVRLVGRGGRQLPLSTATGLRLHRDDLCGHQERRRCPGCPGLAPG
jgi:hypothetical protein